MSVHEYHNKKTTYFTIIEQIKIKKSDPYLERFGSSTTVESETEVDFVVFFQNLKSSLSPPGGTLVHAAEADLNSATAGEFGHCGCHGLLSSWCTLEAGTCDQTNPKQGGN